MMSVLSYASIINIWLGKIKIGSQKPLSASVLSCASIKD